MPRPYRCAGYPPVVCVSVFVRGEHRKETMVWRCDVQTQKSRGKGACMYARNCNTCKECGRACMASAHGETWTCASHHEFGPIIMFHAYASTLPSFFLTGVAMHGTSVHNMPSDVHENRAQWRIQLNAHPVLTSSWC